MTVRGWGCWELILTAENGTKVVLRLENTAFCPDFLVLVVSTGLLANEGIFWGSED